MGLVDVFVLGVVLWCCLARESESPATLGTQRHQDEKSCHLWLNVIRCLGAHLASVMTMGITALVLEQLLKGNDKF